ncbi:hypothetical protein L873DRAFT_1806217 [Choiromyces venosus 120613-1]|uniref:Uncharacterized protein n=1 Tax=Choiromyces venosus 120613-1 TaxID=1336337 RepID=A0A3N4JRS9_9PEZI|nr:hypothetical protein L873DRAFT_1806217 [Choiromyces venosus 120613-1]
MVLNPSWGILNYLSFVLYLYGIELHKHTLLLLAVVPISFNPQYSTVPAPTDRLYCTRYGEEIPEH